LTAQIDDKVPDSDSRQYKHAQKVITQMWNAIQLKNNTVNGYNVIIRKTP